MKFDKAMLDPAKMYTAPVEILKDEALSQEQKLKLLRRWEFDEREESVAEEEAMGADRSSRLDEVLEALRQLGAQPHEQAAPTKQGGE
ncbi:hypothetical protein [Marinobacterium litorale]|jgi:hypothetical protein|uniref:hypothetical protein n=1 Tax=Marinobacterium litorale TaxID=404770 RepID=UPI0003FBFDCB|nr:hypothetical protein [Marinobacterium litorale]